MEDEDSVTGYIKSRRNWPFHPSHIFHPTAPIKRIQNFTKIIFFAAPKIQVYLYFRRSKKDKFDKILELLNWNRWMENVRRM
jgi:hypothetical protein